MYMTNITPDVYLRVNLKLPYKEDDAMAIPIPNPISNPFSKQYHIQLYFEIFVWLA